MVARDDGLTAIEDVFTPDQIRELDTHLGPPLAVAMQGRAGG